MSVSRYKGTRWRVQCHDVTKDKNIHVGVFDSESEALQAEARWYRDQKQRRRRSPTKTPQRERSSWTLYRLRDANGALLYVGISSAALKRMHQHEIKQSWWLRVAMIAVEHYDSQEAALAAENRAIRSENPVFNGRPPLEDAIGEAYEWAA